MKAVTDWCDNLLLVAGPQPDLDRFEKAAAVLSDNARTALSLERLVPIRTAPTDSVWANMGLGGVADRYYSWGTKWDIEAHS